MERRGSPQEPLGIFHRLFRMIMNIISFQSHRRITLGRATPWHLDPMSVPITAVHRNRLQSMAGHDRSSVDNHSLVEVKSQAKHDDLSIGSANAEVQDNGAAQEACGGRHKVIVSKKDFGIGGNKSAGSKRRISQKGKVHDMNLPRVQKMGADKEVKNKGEERDQAKNKPVNATNSHNIDVKAEQFIRKKRENLRVPFINDPRSSVSHFHYRKKSQHP